MKMSLRVRWDGVNETDDVIAIAMEVFLIEVKQVIADFLTSTKQVKANGKANGNKTAFDIPRDEVAIGV